MFNFGASVLVTERQDILRDVVIVTLCSDIYYVEMCTKLCSVHYV